MKYYVTHTCGHDSMVELFGPHKNRDWRISKLESEECPKCHAEHATERDIRRGYEPLTGTVKQIGWASDIREDMFAELASFFSCAIRRVKNSDRLEVAQAWESGEKLCLAVYNGLAREWSAQRLIDHRGSNAKEIIRLYAK